MKYLFQGHRQTSIRLFSLSITSVFLVVLLLVSQGFESYQINPGLGQVYDFFKSTRNGLRQWLTPNVGWETATPESLGMNGAKLDALRDELAANGARNLLIVRHNKIAYEWYDDTSNVKKKHSLAAMAKGVTGSIALMVAVDDGLVALDDPAWKYIPEWKEDPLKSQIKIKHLANHTSGIPNIPFGQGEDLAGWKKDYDDNFGDRFSLAITRAPVVFTPGTQTAYSSVGYDVLAYILTVSLQDSPEYSDLNQFLKTRVMDPLEIPEAHWQLFYGESSDVNGMTVYGVGSGASYTARAVGRLGQLMLDRGSWNGQQLVSPEIVDAITTGAGIPTDQREIDSGTATLPLGWVNNSQGVWPSLPRDAYAASGGTNKVVLVVPSLDLVVVRLGSPLPDENADGNVWPTVEAQLFAPVADAVIRPEGSSLAVRVTPYFRELWAKGWEITD